METNNTPKPIEEVTTDDFYDLTGPEIVTFIQQYSVEDRKRLLNNILTNMGHPPVSEEFFSTFAEERLDKYFYFAVYQPSVPSRYNVQRPTVVRLLRKAQTKERILELLGDKPQQELVKILTSLNPEFTLPLEVPSEHELRNVITSLLLSKEG